MSPVPAIPDEVARDVHARLDAAEREHDVRIVHACESGSRAWGFASPDSDYDVRFLYVHRPEWYLSFDVERRRDVIEYPIVDEIDIGGWDVRKAMYLLTRTNGALLEWLTGPIRYRETGPLSAGLRELAPRVANDVALRYHYMHLAKSNAGEHFRRGERVRLKKYFYVLRALLAIRHVERGHGLPPVEFARLVETVAPAEIVPSIEILLAAKRTTPELGEGDPMPELDAFIRGELARHADGFSGRGRPETDPDGSVRDALNALFRRTIERAWTA